MSYQPMGGFIDVDERKISFLDHFEPSKATLPKTHFVEWFSGDEIDSIWNLNNENGTGSGVMVNEINEGFQVQSGGNNNNSTSFNFNNIRHYSETGCVCIAIAKRHLSGVDSEYFIGFMNNSVTFYSVGADQAVLDSQNSASFMRLTTSNGSSTRTNTTIVPDNIFHLLKVECLASNIEGSIDGTLEATNGGSTVPNLRLQPVITARARSANAAQTRIRYYEAYNT